MKLRSTQSEKGEECYGNDAVDCGVTERLLNTNMNMAISSNHRGSVISDNINLVQAAHQLQTRHSYHLSDQDVSQLSPESPVDVVKWSALKTGDGLSSIEDMREVTLSWLDVHAHTTAGSTSTHILKGVSGFVEPGTLLAIMGASGSGKSTLLNALTYRSMRNIDISGDIRLNGIPSGPEISNLCAYVEQEDLFLGTLRVREHLYFQALLKMDQRLPVSEKRRRVEQVILELGLSTCADTLIGIPNVIKGISGGELKRLAFASEILTNPCLMLCDEPTTGLDSYMAQNVVSTLKQLARNGKTIISTIHQPSSEVFSMFDRVMLLAEGRCAYLGSCADATQFFSRLGHHCPQHYNPADFYIHTLALLPHDRETSKRRIQDICDAYDRCNIKEDVMRTIHSLHGTVLSDNMNYKAEVKAYKRNQVATWYRQLHILLWRSLLINLRHPAVIYVRMSQRLYIALILGLIFYQQQLDQKGVMNINGALYSFVGEISFDCLYAVIETFISEFPIFHKEYRSGMYYSGVYYACKYSALVPHLITEPIVFTCIAYWLIGLYNDASTFLSAVAIMILIANASTGLGYLISASCPNVSMGLAVISPLVVPLFLFGGFFINIRTIPEWVWWLQYVSWFRFGHEALQINQWSGVRNISCVTSADEVCRNTGADVLEEFHFSADNLTLDIAMLLALPTAFHLAAYIALYVRVNV